MEQDKKVSKEPRLASSKKSEAEIPAELPAALQDIYRKMAPETRRPRSNEDAMAAAREVVQRLAAEAEAENPLHAMGEETDERVAVVCPVCGYRNRENNKYCGMCGLSLAEEQKPRRGDSSAAHPGEHERVEMSNERHGPVVAETHHYHHHYHHHYFQGGTAAEAGGVRPVSEVPREGEKLRSSAGLRSESMSRSEAAVRRVIQEWVVACNTKRLDDLLELYVPDGLVLRSNYPAVRGAAAIREFFFSALDAGLGEVELEPIRVEVVGDMAYEAGKCKALVPGTTGKRREERGKYLCVFARQSNGEWKIASDCWSSDLSLVALESDVTPVAKIRKS